MQTGDRICVRFKSALLLRQPYPLDPKLVSSSTNSPITLWSLSRRKCLGTLSSAALPNGSGGAAKEPGVRTAQLNSSFKILVVGNKAGVITIYRTREWAIVKRLNSSSSFGNAGLNNTAIEPRKGRLMLSMGKDCCLRMWDLSNYLPLPEEGYTRSIFFFLLISPVDSCFIGCYPY
ncbi:hypothetical protein PPACK8108_LOCUS22638 [Phakopsora pachyrhizi]|uniref:Uncharacterized protein n=1 Tax=Phakopsora pachyrhizi TaxID=170000 RepID=A0AAV0BKP9_PHAPC|nr:hypothetical protein PPACK8108_LOCUS22638 [Phakopsora pachyrhizi]